VNNFKSFTLILIMALSCKTKPKQKITFGIEIETLPKKNPKVLNYYHPETTKEEKWLSLSLDEKISTAIQYKNKYHHSAKFKKIDCNITSKDDFTFCKKLTKVLTGEYLALEFNNMVFPSIEELKKFSAKFIEKFGEGYTQTHVVFPKVPLKHYTGYAILEHDLAMNKRLEDEYDLYLQTQNNAQKLYFPAANFIKQEHIDPMNSTYKREALIKEQQANDNKEILKSSYAAAALRNAIYDDKLDLLGVEFRTEDQAFGQTFFRKNVLSRLEKPMRRLVKLIESGQYFSPFSPLDKVELPYWSLQEKKYYIDEYFNYIKKHSKIDLEKEEKYLDEIIKSKEIKHLPTLFGRADVSPMFFPLRPWVEYPAIVFAQDKKLNEKIITKSTTYLKTILKEIQKGLKNYKKNPANKNQITQKFQQTIQVAIGKWASELKLSQHLESYIDKICNVNKD
jgi:hypothetical protein